MVEIDISSLKRSPGEVKKLTMAVDMPPVLTEAEQIEFDGPVKLDLVLTNVKDTISVAGDVNANLRLSCGSCLDFFIMPVRAEVAETYYNQGQAEITPGEDWLPYTGDVLDLTPEVLKSIMVELPMRLVCRDDCKGLCPACGKNRNREECLCTGEAVDPRLEVLKQLLEKK